MQTRGLHSAPRPAPAVPPQLYVAWLAAGALVAALSLGTPLVRTGGFGAVADSFAALVPGGPATSAVAEGGSMAGDGAASGMDSAAHRDAAAGVDAADAEDGADAAATAPLAEAGVAVVERLSNTAAASSTDVASVLPAASAPGAVDFATAIEVLLQDPELAGGCEIASQLCLLAAMGIQAEAHDFVDNYVMSLEGQPDMVNGYSGSPYTRGACFPPVVVQAGNAYLEKQGSDWRFVERKNNAFSRLLQVVETGRPVLVWTTMGMEDPQHTETVVEGYHWYANEHCVVLYGKTDDKLLVMDPMEGLVERDAEAFEDIYVQCGSMAVAISRYGAA